MGSVKDAYVILADLWDRISGGLNLERKKLASDLGAIAALLDSARLAFESREVPTRDGHELAVLVSHTDALASLFKQEDSGLAEVFDVRLRRISQLMRDADFLIDGVEREGTYEIHPSFTEKDAKYPEYAANRIEEACKEMKRAAGQLSAYQRKYESTA